MSKPLTAFFAKKPAVEKHTHEEEVVDAPDAKKVKTDSAPDVPGVPSLSTSKCIGPRLLLHSLILTMRIVGPTWRTILAAETSKPYYKELMSFLAQEAASKKTIFPPTDDARQSILTACMS